MRDGYVQSETRLFSAIALFFVGCWVAALVWHHHTPAVQSARISYGMNHLAAALLAIACMAGLGMPLLGWVYGWAETAKRPSARLVAALTGVFCAVWVPVWMAGGFAEDDWRLLAAASIRKVLFVHPSLSLWTLDSVDGNFRPLGTVLYFGYALRWFGERAHIFGLGPLLLTLASSLTAYAFVLELGYPAVTAWAASLLFLSRGLLYTIVAWSAALGDGIALLLCGLVSLLVLRSMRVRGLQVLLLHGCAWCVFAVATLGKQSAFVIPLVVALLLLIRPGKSLPASPLYRVRSAGVALAVYGATAAAVFAHAKALYGVTSPYPIGLTWSSVLGTFSYLTCYLAVLQFPSSIPDGSLISALLGLSLFVAVVVAWWRRRAWFGERPHDVVFAGAAAFASLSLFVFLQTRQAAYYGGMAAFWISVGLAIVFTGTPQGEASQIRGRTLLLVLVLSGFAEIRLEQTGLLPSGGYVWGTFSSDVDRAFEREVNASIAASPGARTVLFRDCRGGLSYPAMVLLEAPAVERILVYDNASGVYLANDRLGLRPDGGRSGLTNPRSYNWTVPMDRHLAEDMVLSPDTVQIRCREGDLPSGWPGAH